MRDICIEIKYCTEIKRIKKMFQNLTMSTGKFEKFLLIPSIFLQTISLGHDVWLIGGKIIFSTNKLSVP